MSTSAMTHPSFPLFTQLVHRLRRTNARYNQIAHQCRRTQRPTHHAKRRAYRTGLRIDTSKACTACPSKHLSAASIQLLPVLDRTALSPVWVTEVKAEADEDASMPSLGLALINLPEVVVQKQLVTLLYHSSSPQPGLGLGLGLGPDSNLNLNVHVDDAGARDMPFRGPIPGAPRWRSIPLPEDSGERGMEAMTLGKSVSCTYGPNVWRGAMTMQVSDSVSTPIDVEYAGGGITVA
ncbi:hypothetical protein J3R82DRAFT_2991 [Butyriboletus roseoflavus]|nr:hypothetical protein J3R82DRAFT_2991 [Butyriboletus roseoflavus]